jgi:signal transduction histidine kinase
MNEEQAALIKRIASVVGHELRNPMAVINNSAYFIKTKLGQDGKLDPKVEKHIAIVVSEIGRADKLIADMLVYSRVVEAKPAELDLNAVVEAALEDVTVPPKVKIKKELGKGGVKALADEAMLRDCVRRLLENALESATDGGTVTLTTSCDKKEAVISVRDTGAGIKAEILPHLFEPFRTTKPRGLGLGLAMIKKVLDAQKGRAEGKNASPGAVFAIYLPKA